MQFGRVHWHASTYLHERVRWAPLFAPLLVGCLALGCEAGQDGAPEPSKVVGSIREGDHSETPAEAVMDVERYDLTGRYDWSKGRLVASVAVTLDHTHVPPARIVLDSRVTAI